ncbi:flotillin family protein [Oscillibacter sp.]|jgi:flotillin|uniref:flotillin family protein n=1 Tax=Oscillibacter sp. TaxID=1945593 RepID=UPI0021737B85|nr:flotillin family protein [Oscillibacter sp.]MCI9648794.1 flotillin family protein [Oscillibacter sp.]
MLDAILSFLPIVIAVAVLLVLLLMGYVKAPPDQAYIISGLKKDGKILIGRAGIKIPFFERLDKLYLGQMTVDIKTEQSVPTNDFINVNVDAVAKVRISPTPEGIKLAAKNFLNKKAVDITRDLQDSLQGNMREIIGTLSLKEINTDRDSFSDQVMQKASKDMDKLGIEILSCNIQNVTDENGLIRDLGADNTSLIKKNAAIAKAQADRDVAIAQAEADKAANEARVLSDTEIARMNNELEIKKAELKIISDTKKAEADAAYTIQQQEQQKSIETATVNAQIAKAERDAELKKQEVEIAKQKLDAEIRAQADAQRYRMEQEAQADLFKRQKDAEAKRYEEEQAAEAAKKAAEAAKYAKEQEAAGIAAVGKAEAQAIQAKALAEAEGIDRKAEAMKKYGQAAMVEMVMQALPDIARNVAEPLSKVEKITMYGEGNSAKLLQDIVNGTTQITEGFTEGMGIDIKSLLSGLLGGRIAAGEGKDGQTIINISGGEAVQENPIPDQPEA